MTVDTPAGKRAVATARCHRGHFGWRGQRAVFVLVLLTALQGFGQATPAGIHLIFRYDDVSLRGPSDLDQQVFECFRNHGVPLVVGVVPVVAASAPNQRSFAAMLPEKTDVALHGYSHRNLPHVWYAPWRQGAEFRRLPLAEQQSRIRRGVARLRNASGRPVTTFIPPGNAYNSDTVRAVKRAGLSCLSAWRDHAFPGDLPAGLALFPATCFLEDVQAAVAAARRLNDTKSVVVVNLHPYDFGEKGDAGGDAITFATLDEVLGWAGAQPDVTPATFTDLSVSAQDVGASRYGANLSLQRALRLLPPRLRPDLQYVYLSEAKARDQAFAWWIRGGIFGVALFAAAAAVSVALLVLLARSRHPSFTVAGRLVPGGIVVLLCAYAGLHVFQRFSFRLVLALLLAAGVLTGMAGAVFRKGGGRRRRRVEDE